MATKPKEAGHLIDRLSETISEEEMDRLLEARQDEITAKLNEAYEQAERGQVAELEPLDQFLGRAHARHKRGR